MYLLEKENNVYNVFETGTSQVIKTFEYKQFNKAKELTRNLNSGFGFNGFTPAFFLKR